MKSNYYVETSITTINNVPITHRENNLILIFTHKHQLHLSILAGF